MTVGIRNCERVADHATAPGESDSTKGIRSDNLEHDVVGLAGWDVCGLRYAVDDVA